MTATDGAVVVLLRRLQARPGAPDEHEVLGRCEGGALSSAIELGAAIEAPVIAIAAGPARREERVLAMALRAGCARAIRIDDSQLGDVDYLGLAQVLAAAIRHVGGRIVVCGDRSGDEGGGAIGPAVAELLGWPHVTGVSRVTVDGEHLLAVRRADGVIQRVRVRTPSVVCMVAPPIAAAVAAAEPKGDYEEEEPTDTREARARRRRARTPAPSIDELDLGDLALDVRTIAPRRSAAGRLRQVRSRGAPTLSTTAADLVARLRADHLLGDDGGEAS